MRSVMGWDIGGAHVKVARVEQGKVVAVRQEPCPLWQNLDRLKTVLAQLVAELGIADEHAVTMTGELADVFPDRASGVVAITEAMVSALAPSSFRLYAGRAGFIDPARARLHVLDIASANWHASASLAARNVVDGLFVDVGSTTTDIIPIGGRRVRAAGYTDSERLACGELVYSGLTRGFLMALAPRAPIDGVWTPLACEHFATTADAYRILGTLAEDADQMPTADGREKTVAASRVRLARMVGRDAGDAPAEAWQDLAAWFAEVQLRQMHDAALLVLSRAPLPRNAPVIAAGIGGSVIRLLADRLGRRFTDFSELLTGAASSLSAANCAPAVAVALLLVHHHARGAGS